MEIKKRRFSITPFQKKIDKPWGYEIIYTNEDSPVVGKILHLNGGARLSLQYHDAKEETLCLIKGEALITLSDKNEKRVEIPMELNKGYFVVINQVHRVTATTDADLIESSTPEKGNTVRLEDDAGRDTETEKMRNMKNRGWNK